MASRLQALAMVVAAAAGLGTAMAQESGSKPAEPGDLNLKFQALDRNRDGMISKMEARGDEDMARQFSALDRDADGDVSLTEFSAFEVAPSKRLSEPGQLGESR